MIKNNYDLTDKYIKINGCNEDARTSWFHECSINKKPCISINSHRKFSEISWDFTSIYNHKEKLLKNSDKFDKFAYLLCQKYQAKKAKNYAVGVLSAFFDKVLVENSEKFAIELYDFFDSLIEEEKNTSGLL